MFSPRSTNSNKYSQYQSLIEYNINGKLVLIKVEYTRNNK